jgi:type IV pilus assembly protein PilV
MSPHNQRGFSMIEVLITIAILMIGLLGLAGLQTRVSTAEFEAYQRAQALVIIQDILERMNANRKNLASYVQTDIGATATLQSCTGKTGAAFDLCQINNQLIGAAESSGGTKLGAMIGARACIAQSAADANTYIVTVAWQGITPTVAPTNVCGTGGYGNEKLRRTVSMPLRFACMTC